MKNTIALLLASALLSVAVSSQATAHASATTASSADMAQGEIRKIDMDNKKITIKHGEIKNLDMPGMTMVFQVKEDTLLGKVKAGDKVRFSAEKIGGAFVVTDIQPAK